LLPVSKDIFLKGKNVIKLYRGERYEQIPFDWEMFDGWNHSSFLITDKLIIKIK